MNPLNKVLPLLGYSKTPTYDLRKKQVFKCDEWVEKNFYLIVSAAMVVFVLVCYISVGGSAVESGLLRNFIAGGV